jgi:hypothetical protein
MKTLIALLLLVLTPSAIIAETITIDLSKVSDGDYVLQVRGGKLVASSPTRVVDLSNPTGPSPTPNPDPGPNPPWRDGITKLTQNAITQGGSKHVAVALSAVYSLASENVPTADPASILSMVSTLSDLATQDEKDRWTNWRNSVSLALAQLQRDGFLDTKPEVVAALKDISVGINAATGVTINPKDLAGKDPRTLGLLDGIFDPEKLERLIQLIEMIMRLFELFKPKAVLMP